MKKKILLVAAMVAIVACLFALGVSAAGSTSNEFAETPDTIEGIAAPTQIGSSERVVMLGSDGLYYTFPAYYILNDNTSCSLKTNNSVNSVLGYADGTSHKSYVVRIEIPTGVTYISGNLLDYNTNLLYAKMSDTVTNTGTKVFQSCTNLETLILSSNLTVIQNDLCKDCKNLSSPIVIPSTVTAINGYCFNGCGKLTSVTNYAENVTSISGNAFSGCPITEFNFPDNLTSIGQYAFNGAQFTSVDLPNTITTLGSGVFQGCTKLTYIRFPERLTQLPHDCLKGTTGSSITIVVPKACTSIYSQFSLGNSGIKEIIFTGSSTDAFVASVQEKASGWVSKIVYGNHCEYYYDNAHEDDNNPCVINCTRCGTVNAPESNPVHSISTTITYASFMAAGAQIADCTNEGCTYCEETIAPALFDCLGYSAPENGNGGIVLGFIVNNTAVNDYKTITGKTVSYGVFAVLKDKLNGDLFVDGEANKNAIVAEMTGYTTAAFEIKVTGFADDQKDTALAMGAYVAVSDGDTTEYSYMQDNTEGEIANGYYFITFNGVVSSQANKN